jgi:hypothetical protein
MIAGPRKQPKVHRAQPGFVVSRSELGKGLEVLCTSLLTLENAKGTLSNEVGCGAWSSILSYAPVPHLSGVQNPQGSRHCYGYDFLNSIAGGNLGSKTNDCGQEDRQHQTPSGREHPTRDPRPRDITCQTQTRNAARAKSRRHSQARVDVGLRVCRVAPVGLHARWCHGRSGPVDVQLVEDAAGSGPCLLSGRIPPSAATAG